MLNHKEKQLYKHIISYWKDSGEYPSYEFLRKKLKYESKRSISILIHILVDKGFLQKDGRKYKLAKLGKDTGGEETRRIPIVGEVACGIPIYAKENVDGYISISTEFTKRDKEYFLLKAAGNSMNNPEKEGNEPINNGDLLLVEMTQDIRSKDRIVALIDDEATVKSYHLYKDYVELRPESKSDAHESIFLTSDFLVQGKVVKVFGK